MKKIPTLLQRDPENRSRVLMEINPECAWALDRDQVKSIRVKLDGTCCSIRDGNLYKRREIKPGKPVPDDFILEDIDSNTGKQFGWVPVDLEAKENQYHAEAWEEYQAFRATHELPVEEGTFELIGPKIQGNPHSSDRHWLISHDRCAELKELMEGSWSLKGYVDLVGFLGDEDEDEGEGVVITSVDGRRAKLKRKDLGLPWPIPNED